jgi:hypothetical protein
MKKFKQFGVVLTLVLVTILASCSSDGGNDGGGGGVTDAAGTIKAKVDGATITSNSSFTTGTKINAGGITTLTLQGTDNSGKGFQFIVNGFSSTGTYAIGGPATIAVIGNYIEANASNPSSTQTWGAPYDSSVAGEIVFTTVTATKVTGTFYFTGKNSANNTTKQITEGSFNVNVTSM